MKKERAKAVTKVVWNGIVEFGLVIIGGCLVTSIVPSNFGKFKKLAASFAVGALCAKLSYELEETNDATVDAVFEFADAVKELSDATSSAANEED